MGAVASGGCGCEESSKEKSCENVYENVEAIKMRGGNTALHSAAARGSVNEIRSLVLERKADVNCQNIHGQTPLHLCVLSCADYDKLTTARLLVSLGARTYIEDKRGRSPLDVAIESGVKDVEMFLKEASTRSCKDGLDNIHSDSPSNKEKAKLEINTSQDVYSNTPEASPQPDRSLALSPGTYQFGVAFDPTLPLPTSLQGLQMQGVLFERDQQDPSRWDEIFMALRPVQMPLALESKSIPKEIADNLEGSRWKLVLVKGPAHRSRDGARLLRCEETLQMEEILSCQSSILSEEDKHAIRQRRLDLREEFLSRGERFRDYERNINPCTFKLRTVRGSDWELVATTENARNLWIKRIASAREETAREEEFLRWELSETGFCIDSAVDRPIEI
uniref:PH domain-containing protein n=1 Tax=Hanusia phi TaxID=3032 RepID=A0A7S0HBT2_9CRYP|mmetsp:Transcript_14965/g.34448  ORF Transcript_14965/g.34448 Transcript_14965/m.34448 type:complete len:392 (+) Transcript_14965:37-1212(+)